MGKIVMIFPFFMKISTELFGSLNFFSYIYYVIMRELNLKIKIMKVLFIVIVFWIFGLFVLAGVDYFFMKCVGVDTEILWVENGIISAIVILIMIGISKIK